MLPRRCGSSASTTSRSRSSTCASRDRTASVSRARSREHWPDLDVIMITGYASIKGAVEAIKQGASDYITKPFQKEEILLATEKVLEKRRLLDEINYLRSQLSNRYSFANIVSRNRVMHEIFETDRGAGAERRDRADHRRVGHRQGARRARRSTSRASASRAASSPSTAPRSPTRCSRASSSATSAAPSPAPCTTASARSSCSSGGTLFLDEIESITLNMQLKLLRVLEEREVERLGGNRKVKVNMRVIAATNVELTRARGRRPDARGLLLPHQRRADPHPAAARSHRGHPAARERVPAQQRDGARARHHRVSNKALSELMGFHWPGNVRELGNVLERAILRTTGSGDPRGRSPGRRQAQGRRFAAPHATTTRCRLKEYLRRAEKDYLSHVLKKNRGSINLSAKHALGRCGDAASQDEAAHAPAGGFPRPRSRRARPGAGRLRG